MPSKVLFVCKRRPANYGASYGLLNSCRFLCNALHRLGVEAKVVEVIDNNFIDREVTRFNPTHVFIEALWVVPDKFDVLIPLHSHRQWYVRLHSNTSFIANEGVAIEWLKRYDEKQKIYPQFHIAPNSSRFQYDIKTSMGISSVYSPNIYCPDKYDSLNKVLRISNPEFINVGCFGAIRPLKNQLIQAMAAIVFAEKNNKKLRFHINHSRLEQNGENAYKNIKALFNNTEHELIEHDWLLHEDFLKLVKTMDVGLQVSFSETFNIVAADFVHANVPIVGSSEITWLNWLYKADATDMHSIVDHMYIATAGETIGLQKLNTLGLKHYNNAAYNVWKNILSI